MATKTALGNLLSGTGKKVSRDRLLEMLQQNLGVQQASAGGSFADLYRERQDSLLDKLREHEAQEAARERLSTASALRNRPAYEKGTSALEALRKKRNEEQYQQQLRELRQRKATARLSAPVLGEQRRGQTEDIVNNYARRRTNASRVYERALDQQRLGYETDPGAAVKNTAPWYRDPQNPTPQEERTRQLAGLPAEVDWYRRWQERGMLPGAIHQTRGGLAKNLTLEKAEKAARKQQTQTAENIRNRDEWEADQAFSWWLQTEDGQQNLRQFGGSADALRQAYDADYQRGGESQGIRTQVMGQWKTAKKEQGRENFQAKVTSNPGEQYRRWLDGDEGKAKESEYRERIGTESLQVMNEAMDFLDPEDANSYFYSMTGTPLDPEDDYHQMDEGELADFREEILDARLHKDFDGTYGRNGERYVAERAAHETGDAAAEARIGKWQGSGAKAMRDIYEAAKVNPAYALIQWNGRVNELEQQKVSLWDQLNQATFDSDPYYRVNWEENIQDQLTIIDNEERLMMLSAVVLNDDFAVRSRPIEEYGNDSTYAMIAGWTKLPTRDEAGDAEAYTMEDERSRTIGSSGATMGDYADQMSDGEKATYFYIYNTQGKQKAMEYLDAIGNEILYNAAMERRDREYQWAKENPWLSSVTDILMTPARGVSAASYMIGNLVSGGKYSPFHHSLDVADNTVRHRQATDVLTRVQAGYAAEGWLGDSFIWANQKFRDIAGKGELTEEDKRGIRNGVAQGLVDLKGGGDSAGDSAVTMTAGLGMGKLLGACMTGLGFGAEALGMTAQEFTNLTTTIGMQSTLLWQSAQAGALSTANAKETGASDRIAAIQGIANFIAEHGTETLGAEGLVRWNPIYKSLMGKGHYVWGSVTLAMVAEGLEEVGSGLFSTSLDKLLSTSESEWDSRRWAYMQEHPEASFEQANIAVGVQYAKELATEAVVVALTTGPTTGANIMMNTWANNREASRTVQELQREGLLTEEEGREAQRTIAQGMQAMQHIQMAQSEGVEARHADLERVEAMENLNRQIGERAAVHAVEQAAADEYAEMQMQVQGAQAQGTESQAAEQETGTQQADDEASEAIRAARAAAQTAGAQQRTEGAEAAEQAGTEAAERAAEVRAETERLQQEQEAIRQELAETEQKIAGLESDQETLNKFISMMPAESEESKAAAAGLEEAKAKEAELKTRAEELKAKQEENARKVEELQARQEESAKQTEAQKGQQETGEQAQADEDAKGRIPRTIRAQTLHEAAKAQWDRDRREALGKISAEEYKIYRLIITGHDAGVELTEEQRKDLIRRGDDLQLIGQRQVFDAKATVDGEDAIVKELSSMGGSGTVTVVRDGHEETERLDNVEFGNPDVEMAYAIAAAFDHLRTGQIFLGGFEMSHLPLTTYTRAFNEIYTAARQGLSLTAAQTARAAATLGNKLTDTIREVARESMGADNLALGVTGRHAATLDEQMRQIRDRDTSAADYRGVELERGIDIRRLSADKKAAIQLLDTLGQKIGMHFQIVRHINNQAEQTALGQDLDTMRQSYLADSGIGENGMFHPGTNKAVIALDGMQGAVFSTAMHETWHWVVEQGMKQGGTFASEVSAFGETILQQMQQAKGWNLQERTKEKLEQYRKAGHPLANEQQAREELIADALVALSGDMAQLQLMQENHPSVLRKIMDGVKRWIRNIRKAVRSLARYNIEAEAMLETVGVERMEQLVRQYDDLMTRAGQNQQLGREHKADQEAVKFSLGEQTDAALEKTGYVARENVMWSLAGTRAQGRFGDIARQASQMAREGATDEAIRKATGAVKGFRGRWWARVDNTQMQIKPGQQTANAITQAVWSGRDYETTLGELYQAEPLYEAYPGIADAVVQIHPIESYDDAAGAMSWRDGHPFIEINSEYLAQMEDMGENIYDMMGEVLQHEIQHIIQGYEGSHRGAAPVTWQQIKDDYETKYQAMVAMEEQLIAKYGEDLLYEIPLTQDYEVDEDHLTPAQEQLVYERMDFVDAMRWGEIRRFMDKYDAIAGREAWDLYRDTVGEREARAQEERGGPMQADYSGAMAMEDYWDEDTGAARFSVAERAGETIDNDKGEPLARVLEGGAVARYSLSSWTEKEREGLRRYLIRQGFDAAATDAWLRDIDSVAAIIARDRARLDYRADRSKSSKKPNGDVYRWTMDFSTLCPKRNTYQGTFDAIQNLMPNTAITAENLIRLNNIMQEMKHQAPCSFCYVEGQRKHGGEFAAEFVEKYRKRHKGGYIPTVADLTTSTGLWRMQTEHPEVYRSFIAANNKRGVASTKPVQLRTDYRGEIRRMGAATIRYLNEHGGLRLQSFSDFETVHTIDMMQVVADMAARGLKSQAYTKVPDFAWIFGRTGIKINLSLVGEGTGLDANGQLIFSSTEGMDFEEAMRLRDAYSETVGTILVGISREHILAAMADDRIDFIIPFHRSNWSAEDRQLMAGMRHYDDFQPWQNEGKLVRGEDGTYRRGNNVENNIQPEEYWSHELSGRENAQRYLDLCAKRGIVPKFEIFLHDNGDGTWSLQEDGSTDGYWKLLIDYKMYDNDGHNAPQRVVRPDFNMEQAERVLNEKKGSSNDGLPVAYDVVERYIQEFAQENPDNAEAQAAAAKLRNQGVRHSLTDQGQTRFSLNEPVEQVRDLVAIHNVDEDGLAAALELGGFPSPSTAVVRSGMGHSMYGPYSVVFRSGTIDPGKNRLNRLYGTDAWTPTKANAPVERALDSNVLYEAEDRFREALQGLDRHYTTEMSGWFSQFVNHDATRDTMDDWESSAFNNLGMLASYMRARGQEVVTEQREEKINEGWDERYVEEYANFMTALLNEDQGLLDQLIEDAEMMTGEELLNKYAEIYAKAGKAAGILYSYMQKGDERARNKVLKRIREAYQWITEGGRTDARTEKVSDWYETRKKLQQQINRSDFRAWLEREVGSAMGERGIRNDVDTFTPTGKRRSFRQTHDAYTLQNIVKAMNRAEAKGGFAGSASGLMAMASKEYTTLDAMRADKGRLQKMDQNDYQQMTDALQDRVSAFVGAVQRSDYDVYAVREVVSDAARAYAKTGRLDTIRTTFARNGRELTAEQVRELGEIFRDAQEIPTGYFEAKPQRAVGFDEVAFVLMPAAEEGSEIVRQLQDRGVEVRFYDGDTYGEDGKRTEALNEALDDMGDVRFSIEETPITYDSLISKPDLVVTRLQPMTKAISRSDLLDISKKNAIKEGRIKPGTENDESPVPQVFVKETGKWISIGNNGLRHGYENWYYEQIEVSPYAGRILKNAILINRARPSKQSSYGTDFYMGAARRSNGKLLFVLFTVDRHIERVRRIDVIEESVETEEDTVHAIRTWVHNNQTGAAANQSGQVPTAEGDRLTAPDTVSVAEALENVKELFADVLPLDVLRELGQERRESEYTQHLIYSLSGVENTDPAMQQLLAENEEFRKLTATLASELNRQELRSNAQLTSKANMQRLARELRDRWKVAIPMKDMTENLTRIFQALTTAKTAADAQSAMQMLGDFAQDAILHAATTDRTQFDQYSEARALLRNLRADRKTVLDVFGDMESYRKGGFGRVIMVNRGMNIDEIFKQANDTFPGLFPEGILNETDQLRAILDFLDATSIRTFNPYEEGEAAQMGGTVEVVTRDLSMRLLQEFVQGGQDGKVQGMNPLQMERMGSLLTQAANLMEESNQSSMGTAARGRTIEAYEQQIAKMRQKLKDNAADYRQRMREAVRREHDRMAGISQAERDRRNARELRDKTMREILRRKSSLMKKLLEPNSNRGFVPLEMQEAVTALLEAVDTEGTLSGTPNKPLTADMLTRARDAYMAINKNGPDDARGPMAAYFNGDLEISFNELIKTADGKLAKDLTQAQLEHLRDIVAGFSAAVINADRMFTQQKRETLHEMGRDMLDQAGARIRAMGEEKVKGRLAQRISKATDRGLLKPVTVFERFKGTVLGDIWENALRPAEWKHIRNIQQAEEFLEAALDRFHQHESVNKDGARNQQRMEFHLASGRTIQLTDQELMTIYALQKREALTGTNHLLGGGITLANKQKGDTHQEYRLTPADLQAFSDALTQEQKDFVDHMVGYLSTTVGEWGNEVTRELYGIEKFRETYYIPIKVNESFVEKMPAQGKDARLKVETFTRTLVQNASNTVEIAGFTRLWCSHVEQMSDFNAFVLPMEDMTRLLNYREGAYDAAGNYIGQGENVRPMLQRAWGMDTVSYIHDFLSRLNGNSRSEEGGKWLNYFRGSAKGAAVTWNLSVAFQQAGAGVRAMAEMDPRDVLPALASGIVSNGGFVRNYKELQRYAPIAVEKAWGYFDTNMNRGLYQRAQTTLRSRLDDAGGYLAGKMDELNWSQIWEACKHEARRLNPGFTEEQVKQRAAERFVEVIDRTQVVDSIFQRSAFATEHGLMSILTSFMSEPIAMYNMVVRTVDKFQDAYRTNDAVGKREARMQAVKTTTAITLSAALTAFLKSLITALRDRDPEKKDKDGNIIGNRSYIDKLLEAWLPNFGDNLLGLFTIFGSMYDNATSNFGNSDLATTWITNLYNAVMEASKGENADWEKVAYRSTQALSNLTGIGFAGLYRDTKAIFSTVAELMDPESLTGTAWDRSQPWDVRMRAAERHYAYTSEFKTDGRKVKPGYYTDMLVEEYMANGFSEDWQLIADTAISVGATASGLENSFKSKLKTAEPMVQQAAQALADGDMEAYNSAMQSLQDGGIGLKTAGSMVNSAYNALVKPEAEPKEPGTGAGLAEALQAEGTSTTAPAKNAGDDLLTDTATAADVKQAVKLYKAAGMTDEKITSKIADKYKKPYILAVIGGNSSDKNRYAEILQTGGVTRDEMTTWTTKGVFSNTKDYGLYWMVKEGRTEDAKRTVQYLNQNYPGGQKAVKEKLLKWAGGLTPGTFDYATVKRVLLAIGISEATIKSTLKK